MKTTVAKVVSLATYKARQERIAARVGAKALAVVRPLVGEKLTKSDIRALASSVFTQVKQEREEAAKVATAFYMSQRVEHLGEALPELEAPKESYTLNHLVKGLSLVLGVGEELTNETDAVTTVTRHVKSGARRQAIGLSLVDAQAQGWARTSDGTSSCSFCLMLISRGPVYRSRESAELRSDAKTFHNRCDCVAVPVFNKKSFPGRDEYLSASKLWAKSTKGKSGPAALAAFRLAITEIAPGGQDAAIAA